MSSSLKDRGACAWSRALAGHRVVQQVLLVIGIGALWQGVSGTLVNAYYLSTPLAVVGQIASWVSDGTLWPHLGTTLATTLLGFGIAATVALPLALIVNDRPFLDQV